MLRMCRFILPVWLLACSTAHAGDRAAVVVATDSIPVLGAAHSLPHSEAEAERVARELRDEAGYDDVRLLMGESATRAAVRTALDEALEGLEPDGVLLWVWVGFGVGGDFGEPTLLTSDATKAEPGGGGIDVVDITAHLVRESKGRSILVAVDAVHDGSVNGLALMGPSAVDWPGLPEEGFAVLSAAGSREIPSTGALLPAIRAAMGTRGDGDGNDRVSVSEWIRTVRAQVESKADVRPATAGALVASLIVSDWSEPVPEAKSKESAPPWSGTTVALVGGGAAGLVASLTMYLGHRPKCRTSGGVLRCGSSEGYQAYQVAQHALGWVGGACVLTGIGLQVLTDGQPMVGFGGRF